MKIPQRPKALLTLAQVLCLLAIVVVLFFFFTPAFVLFTYAEQAEMLQDSTPVWTSPSALLCLRDAAIGVCLVCVGMEAIGICGRVKKSSAFCEKNEQGLGRITIAMLLSGLIALLFGDSVVSFLLTDLPAISPMVERFLLPFMLLTLAAMVRVVQLLMRRALALQTENDLTV